MRIKSLLVLLSLMVLTAMLPMSKDVQAASESWRSSLYPDNWAPGYKDNQGQFLHDFSYAGYRLGEVKIPGNPPGQTYNAVTQYGADPTGVQDSTSAIQEAMDDAGATGGGIVLPLPARR